ncbi:putative Complex I intermediate-associated protein 84 [Seiridium cardinale]|uniref:Complex I intermediate-associated protein 84 n=1 Tax=Seiridium cardinale TaxID=138064 RepID=A0ABR2Y8F0_9PEZI
MRSQLTRHVLRRLHAHQGIPPCPTARPSLRRHPTAYRIARPIQRRTFLNFFQKAPRILKEPEVEPGFESLLKYGAMKKENLRPPPREELVKGFRDFFRHKKLNNRPVNAMQARVAHHVLNHLVEPGERNVEYTLSLADLRTAQLALQVRPRDDPTELVELAKALFLQIRDLSKQRARNPRLSKDGEGRSTIVERAPDIAVLLRILAQHGRSLEARHHLLSSWATLQSDSQLGYGRTKGLWIPVLRGLAQEGKEEELLEFLSIMQSRSGLEFGRTVHEIMTTFYARQNDLEKMKEWFYKPIEPSRSEETPAINDQVPLTSTIRPSPTQQTYQEVFRCAMRNGDLDWAISEYQSIADDLQRLSQTHYSDEAVLLIYRFAVLLLGKGPEHVEQMMMSNSNPKLGPNIDIINTVIAAAVEKGDLYMAERLSALVSKLEIEPDRRHYSLVMDYRIRAGDLDGAFTAYRLLSNYDNSDEDWPLLNKLIRGLCSLPSPNHEKVLDITSYLEQLSATLEPETVVSICMTFMDNDEQYEVIDTLSLHTVHYSWDERTLVSKAFVRFCLDAANSTARVWDAYALLRQFFPDTALDDRVQIMDGFFDRKRADMACHVFGHMRQHSNPVYRPTLDTYIRCFEGIGRSPDLESLKMIHNMLKMDTTIQPTTQLYNALMIAYTACDEPHSALDHWKDIDNSAEGPSYQSLEIVFRTYEITPFGAEPAKQLWEKLQRMEIELPANVVTAYAGVLAYHSNVEGAKRILEEMEADIGQRPDVLTLAVVYNALPNDEFKDEFEGWAKEWFPHIWSQLEKKRRKRDMEGFRTFQILRPWKA